MNVPPCPLVLLAWELAQARGFDYLTALAIVKAKALRPGT